VKVILTKVHNQKHIDEFKEKLTLNEQFLTKEDYLVATTAIAQDRTTILPPEQESGIFYLYASGRSLKQIALQSGLTHDVVVLSALQYNWRLRKSAAEESADGNAVEALGKDAVNKIMAMTQLAIDKDMQDILSGSQDPRVSLYIPKNVRDLAVFLDTVGKLNKIASFINPTHQTQITVDNRTVQATVQTSAQPDPIPQVVSGNKLKLLQELIADESTVTTAADATADK
jgi:hypothetical protein